MASRSGSEATAKRPSYVTSSVPPEIGGGAPVVSVSPKEGRGPSGGPPEPPKTTPPTLGGPPLLLLLLKPAPRLQEFVPGANTIPEGQGPAAVENPSDFAGEPRHPTKRADPQVNSA